MAETILEAPAGESKARWLTKRGKPVAKLVAIEEEPPTLFRRLKGTATIRGDIMSRIEQDWHAERGIL